MTFKIDQPQSFETFPQLSKVVEEDEWDHFKALSMYNIRPRNATEKKFLVLALISFEVWTAYGLTDLDFNLSTHKSLFFTFPFKNGKVLLTSNDPMTSKTQNWFCQIRFKLFLSVCVR